MNALQFATSLLAGKTLVKVSEKQKATLMAMAVKENLQKGTVGGYVYFPNFLIVVKQTTIQKNYHWKIGDRTAAGNEADMEYAKKYAEDRNLPFTLWSPLYDKAIEPTK